MAGPLAGLRVLDATTSAAGSIMTMVLADYGADVIKIESGAGDPVRRQEGFLAWGRGKRSALFDASSQSRQKLLELISGADILVECYANSPLESFDLAAKGLLDEHPRLVVCTLSGGEGPDEVDPALTDDLLVSARLGLTVDGLSQRAPSSAS
jgi:crotonobetainyl-CoA:carnitine CoA-transferase CaiB-like acyl-CoA transferase